MIAEKKAHREGKGTENLQEPDALVNIKEDQIFDQRARGLANDLAQHATQEPPSNNQCKVFLLAAGYVETGFIP